MILKLFTRLRCKHDDYRFITNFYGDAILKVSPSNRIYRSLYECSNCGKLMYSSQLNMDKNIVNFRDYDKEYGWLYEIFKEQ